MSRRTLIAVAAAAAAAVLHAAAGADAFYLPGVVPHEYADGEQVELKVNKLTSTRTHLGFNYYDLPVCRPKGGIKRSAENLGEHLTGETIENSPYELYTKKNESCKVLCPTLQLGEADVELVKTMIRREYSINWIVDNMPAATVGLTADGSVLYSRGFPVGEREMDTGNYFIFNHVRITIKYHEDPKEYEGARIVGFEVEPMSVDQGRDTKEAGKTPKLKDCPEGGYKFHSTAKRQYIAGKGMPAKVPLTYSYDVNWEPSDVRWASRWDIYLSMGNRYSNEIHWFSIVNSFIIVLFLSAMVAMILVRALNRDISRYNRVATDEERAEDREETGWKLVHGDVFRPPFWRPQLFAVTVGVGTQVLSMASITVIFAALGFLSPANRGSLMIALLLLFLFCGIAAGYVTARLHKFFNGKQWQRTTLLTALGYPTIVFGTLFTLNLFVWHTGSVNAVSFVYMLAVLALWLFVSVPLVFLGAYYGFKAEKVEVPVSVKPIPRQIPPQPWYLRWYFTLPVGGMLPFGAVFVELFFILSSIWLDMYYYLFGFLLLVFALLVVTCAEIAIVLTYFQLCSEDYRWWWRSFAVPGASGGYLFLYSVFYFVNRLNIAGGIPTLLYFGYMGMVSVTFTLCTGVVGFMASFWFNRKIYSAVKVD